jgi:AraC-like DNA-binding protein
MSTLRFLRVRYAENLLQVLENSGLPTGRALSAVGLQNVELKAGSWMPFVQLDAFIEEIIREHGYWDLGLTAAMLPRVQHSSFSRKTLFEHTLFQSLQSICSRIHMEDTSALFRLVRENNNCWIHCGKIEGGRETVRQVELYRFGAIIDTIRYTAGANWLPETVQLQSIDDGRLQDVELFQDINIRFNSPGLAIQVPNHLLPKAPRLNRITPTYESTDSDTVKSAPRTFEMATKTVIRNQIELGNIHVNDVAHCLGVSTRSLQRYLAVQNTSFSILLEQSKTERAQELLGSTSLTHRQIARALGYRHQTDFSRAFRRVCGVTPRQFRSMMQND